MPEKELINAWMYEFGEWQIQKWVDIRWEPFTSVSGTYFSALNTIEDIEHEFPGMYRVLDNR